jgi:ribosomal protein L29
MKSNKEIAGLSASELNGRKEELKKELLKLNVQVGMGTNPQDSGKIKQIKKNIARINTSLKQKEDIK